MLVLTRKQQEKIHIGQGITITVLKMKGSSVRLGIEAPSEVSVVRGELKFRDRADETPEESVDEAPKSRCVPVRETNWDTDANAVLQRVPRAEANRLRGPLRAMLDQRVGVGE